MQKQVHVTAWIIALIFGANYPTGAADLPKATQKVMTDQRPIPC